MIGADYVHYVNAFETIKFTGSYYMERGYVLLNRFVSTITNEYVGIAVAVNILLFIPLYYYITKFVDKKYWGLCVFIFATHPYMFIQSSFNAMRQGCATGIVLFGLTVFLTLSNRRKLLSKILFLVFVLLAAQFHRIAYVMVIIPIILSINWKKYDWYVMIVLSIVANLIGIGNLGELILTQLSFNISYLHYDSSLLNNPIYVIFVSLFILYLLYHYEDFKSLSSVSKKRFDLYMFSLCFLLFAVSNDMLYRVYIILAFCTLPCIPIVCKGLVITHTHIKIKNESKIVELLYLFYYFCFYVGYVSLLAINKNAHYIPFKFFFN